MAGLKVAASPDNPSKKFLFDLDGELNLISGLIEALNSLTIELPVNERKDRYVPADAVLIALEDAVRRVRADYTDAVFPNSPEARNKAAA